MSARYWIVMFTVGFYVVYLIMIGWGTGKLAKNINREINIKNCMLECKIKKKEVKKCIENCKEIQHGFE